MKAKEKMTKAELIRIISNKIKTVKPFIRNPFIKSLKYKKLSELQRLARDIKADKDGYGFYLR